MNAWNTIKKNIMQTKVKRKCSACDLSLGSRGQYALLFFENFNLHKSDDRSTVSKIDENDELLLVTQIITSTIATNIYIIT